MTLKNVLPALLAMMLTAGCGDSDSQDPAGPGGSNPAGRLYVLNQGDATMYVYDTRTFERVDSIGTRVMKPHYIEFAPDGNHFYITTLEATGHIARFDARTLDFVDSVTVSPAVQPSAIAITADSRYGYVCNFSTPDRRSYTDKFDLTTLQRVARVQAGALSHDLKITSDGSIVVVCNRFSDELSLIHTDADTVNMFSIDPDSVYPVGSHKYGPFGVAIDHRDSLAFVACMDSRQVRYFDIAAGQVVDSVDIPFDTTGFISGPTLLAVSPDDRTVYLTTRGGNSMVAFDVASKTIVANIAFSTVNPFGITSSDDGSRIFVACVGIPAEHGRVYAIDGSTLAKIDSVDVGRESFGLIWKSF